jgi:phosphoribosylformylglycinamidine synthase I
MKPKVCVLKTDGINCDEEMMYAFMASGGHPELVHVNQLRTGAKKLADYAVLAIPGGFSYGDDIASGKVLATELMSFLSAQLKTFVQAGKPIIGICNGFQVLVKAGLLPGEPVGKRRVTLTENIIGRFECRWVDLAVAKSRCKFVTPTDFAKAPIPMQVAHGEGRFFGSSADIQALEAAAQVVFKYSTASLGAPTGFPDNPNGSMGDIAGICDQTGLVLGMMPHPERSLQAFHPHRTRTGAAHQGASAIFNSIINYAKHAAREPQVTSNRT